MIVPPDKGWSWVVCFAGFMVQFITDGTLYCFPTFEDEVANYLNVTEQLIDDSNAIVSLFYFLGGPVASALVNKCGCRIVGVLGGLLGASGYFLCSFLTYHYLVLYVLQGFIGGIGLSFNYFCANVIVSLYFEKWRGLATGLGASGTGMGQIIIYPVVGVINDTWGWRISFIAIGILLSFTSLMAIMYLPLEPVWVTSKTDLTVEKSKPIKGLSCKKKKIEVENTEDTVAAENCCSQFIFNLFDPKLLSSPAFWVYLWSGFFVNGGTMGVVFIIQHRAREAFDIAEVTARYLILVLGICNMVSRILAGLLPRIFSGLQLIIFCAITMAIAAISFFATSFAWAKYPAIQFVNSCIVGIFLAPYCLRPIIAVDLFGLQHLTNSFGLQMEAMGFGVAVEIFATNYILQNTGNDYRYASAFIFVFFILASVCYLLMKPVRNWEIKRGILVT